jgi:hypothetical protein
MAKRKTTKPAKATKVCNNTSPDTAVPEVAEDMTVPRIHNASRSNAGEFDSVAQAEAGRARSVQEQLLEMASRRTSNPRPATYAQASTVKQTQLPHVHFLMQWLTDNYGYPGSGLVNFVGDTSCGKTTKMLTDAAHIMKERNAPLLYMSCEGKDKTMSRDRMLRCMHSDPVIALQLLSNVSIEYTQSVLQLMPQMVNWAKVQREGCGKGKNAAAGLPMSIPLLIIVDPFSRLLNAVESEGNVSWDKVGKEQRTEVGTQKVNLGHSKYAQHFCRWLQCFVDEYNVLVFVAHSRNADVDFDGSAARAVQGMSEWKSHLMRYKFLGMSAFESLAALTFIMTSLELIKDPFEKKLIVSKRVRCRLRKQSHGIGERLCSWELRMEHKKFDLDQGKTYLDPPIHYSEGFCDMLQEQKLLGVRINEEGLVSVGDLGLKGLTPLQVDLHLHRDKALINNLGIQLGINGYVNLVEDIVTSVKETSDAKVKKTSDAKVKKTSDAKV